MAAAEDPDLLYTIPTFQNPAGCTLSAAKRRRVADLATAGAFWVYEDDPYTLLRFRGERPAALHELAPERVIWATSFTKTVAPGLRVGYLVLPPELATADIPEAVQRLAAAVDAARLSQAATAGA